MLVWIVLVGKYHGSAACCRPGSELWYNFFSARLAWRCCGIIIFRMDLAGQCCGIIFIWAFKIKIIPQRKINFIPQDALLGAGGLGIACSGSPAGIAGWGCTHPTPPVDRTRTLSRLWLPVEARRGWSCSVQYTMYRVSALIHWHVFWRLCERK